MKKKPLVSIITPVYNQVDYLEETILSVINQEYENLEYIIIDGGSTDGTLEIIKKYEKHLAYWISEPDNGMYDALDKGFKKSTGEIMGYINSDDLLMPGALDSVAKIFSDISSVEWIHGLNTFINFEGRLVHTKPAKRFSLMRYIDGDYKYLQQESSLWKRSLWNRSGAQMNVDLKLAGDFDLWFRFFQHATLYHCSLPIGGWRKRDGQLSGLYLKEYQLECDSLIRNFEPTIEQRVKLKEIRKVKQQLKILKKIRIFNTRYLEKELYNLYDLNHTDLEFDHTINTFKVVNANSFTYY